MAIMDIIEPSEDLKKRYIATLPSSEVFDGIVWIGSLITSANIHAIREKEFGENDVIIATCPKSGTTWASEILSCIAHEGATDRLRSTTVLARVPWIERDYEVTLKGHPLIDQDGTHFSPKKNIWFTHLPLRLLPRSILVGKCKLLYVARNPKDQAVSFFHFHKSGAYFGNQEDLTWDDFYRLSCSGDITFGSWFDHVLGYCNFVPRNANMKMLFYEDMKRDLTETVHEIEEFIGVPLSVEQRSAVVDHCSFESMKENPATNIRMPQYHETFSFMRKGIVGDWKNYFTVAQSEAFDELFENKMRGSGIHFKYQ